MPRAGRPARSRGYTLVELLIVLAVVASLAGLSWPAVREMLAKSELRNAARQFRAALVKVRLDAIQSGTVRQLRYRPGRGRFEVSALASLDDEQSGDEPGLAARAPPNGSGEDRLGAGVSFQEPDEPQPEDRPPDSAEPETQPWAAPILFYPNGQTSNARVRLEGRRGYHIEVTLRGITGAVTVGKLDWVEPPEWWP